MLTVMKDPPIFIAVFGPTGTGKTTFVNNASGAKLKVGDDLSSCTKDVTASNTFQIGGRDVVLIDTPGFDDTELADAEILKHISASLAEAYQRGIKLTAIIYLHRITDPRMSGVSRRTFKIFRELCGEKPLSNVLIVTTMWSDPPNDSQIKREMQLKEDPRFYQLALQAGAQMTRCLRDDPASAREIVCTLLDKSVVVLQVQQEIVDEKRAFFTTGAAQALNQELVEMQKRHEEDILEMKEELRQAKENNNMQAQNEVRTFLEQAISESRRLAKEIEALRDGFEEERAQWRQRVSQAIREREEARRAQEELAKRVENLRQEGESVREEDKKAYEKRLAKLTRELETLRQRDEPQKKGVPGVCVVM